MKGLNHRLLRHVAFWIAYWAVMGFIAGRYDFRFERAYLHEALELPVRMALVYATLWRTPLLERGNWPRWLAEVLVFSLIALLLRRMLMSWVIYPRFYAADYSMVFWDINRLIYSWLDHALTVSLVLAVRFVRRARTLAAQSQALLLEKTTAELHALRSQTHPHFLFNTLTSLYALARKNDPRAPEMILKLAGLLRFILSECTSTTIPLERELHVIEEYISLEQMRFGDRVRVTAAIETGGAQVQLPPLLLLPLVENAFTHGVGESRGESEVQYSLTVQPGTLVFWIRNSREPQPASPQGTGTGLQNLRRQLALQFPARYRLDIEEKPDTFTVTLQIPLDHN